MSKTRVYELARKFDIDSKTFISRIEKLGIAVKSHSSTLTDSDVERIRKEFALGERKEIVEKRVKSGVIRRRRRPQEPVEVPSPVKAKEEEAENPEAETTEKPKVVEKEGLEAKKEETRISDIKLPDKKIEVAEKEPEPDISVEKKKEKRKVTAKLEEAPEAAEKKVKETPTELKAVSIPEKEKKRPLKVLVDEVPVAKKKAFVKQRIEKKGRRLGKGTGADRVIFRKPEKKETRIPYNQTPRKPE